MPDVFGALVRRIEQIEAQLNQLDRRQNNFLREGTVTELFAEEGLARVDAHGLVSKKVPWLQRAGSIREWTPPAIGERIVLISPSGEPGQGLILPGGYTGRFPQPHDKAGEKRVTVGEVSITQTGEGVFIEAGGVRVEITADGLRVLGGRVVHNVKSIGDDHKHLGVKPGGGITDIPV